VSNLTELDRGVYRIDRPDGPGRVARQFPLSRPAGGVVGLEAAARGVTEAHQQAEAIAARAQAAWSG
jgi:hypothetical protein